MPSRIIDPSETLSISLLMLHSQVLRSLKRLLRTSSKFLEASPNDCTLLKLYSLALWSTTHSEVDDEFIHESDLFPVVNKLIKSCEEEKNAQVPSAAGGAGAPDAALALPQPLSAKWSASVTEMVDVTKSSSLRLTGSSKPGDHRLKQLIDLSHGMSTRMWNFFRGVLMPLLLTQTRIGSRETSPLSFSCWSG